jgi:hypothetical protein
MFGIPKPSMRYIVPLEEKVNDQTISECIPQLWEDETIDFIQQSIELHFNNETNSFGKGKLFITSKRVVWLSDNGEKSVDFDVPYITLHAISRDVQTYPKPCVYCQVDVDEDEIDADESILSEFYLAPEDENDLMKVFEALSHAALINPDPDEGDEDDDGFIYNVDEVELGAEQARRLEHLESVFQFPVEENGDYMENGEDEEENS